MASTRFFDFGSPMVLNSQRQLPNETRIRPTQVGGDLPRVPVVPIRRFPIDCSSRFSSGTGAGPGTKLCAGFGLVDRPLEYLDAGRLEGPPLSVQRPVERHDPG